MPDNEQNKFLSDWMYINSGDEAHPDFHMWAGLTLLGAVLGRKVWVWHGEEYFKIEPNIYTCLVGTSGSGKSTAKGRVKNVMYETFPDYFLSDSIQSREDILQKMGLPECLRTYRYNGNIEEYRPFFLVVNELKNFLSVSPEKMLDFLVDIFDEKYFSTGFKTTTSQKFKHPYVSMLACATPEWFMSNLKIDLFTGGLGRRLFIVFRKRDKIIPFPKPPEGYAEVRKRCIEHLRRAYADTTIGEVKRTDEANLYWAKIYTEMKSSIPDDPILKQFYESKSIQVLKIASILAFDVYPFTYVMEKYHLEAAYSMVNGLEKDIVRLTSGIGNNIMAGVAAQMEQGVYTAGGQIQEAKLRSIFYRSSPNGQRDYNDALDFLNRTEKLIVCDHIAGNVSKRWVMTPERYREYIKQGKIIEQPLTSQPPSPS